MKYIPMLWLVLFLVNCKNETNKPKVKSWSAQEIIDKSIAVSGGDYFKNATISFNFRGIAYRAKRANGLFELSRFQTIGNDTILDMLSNNGFQRKINNAIVTVADSMALKYKASVNSVHYFSVLPYGLNDSAVNKALIGEEHIKNNEYYKVKITFNENGGGEDYDDVFIYWIHKTYFKPHYLAYSYHEDNGKGMRFREAYNERFVKGLRFVDYNNYKPKNSAINLVDLGKAFDNNQLQLVSKIDLENISVDLVNMQ